VLYQAEPRPDRGILAWRPLDRRIYYPASFPFGRAAYS
jgi:hypothetical protein